MTKMKKLGSSSHCGGWSENIEVSSFRLKSGRRAIITYFTSDHCNGSETCIGVLEKGQRYKSDPDAREGRDRNEGQLHAPSQEEIEELKLLGILVEYDQEEKYIWVTLQRYMEESQIVGIFSSEDAAKEACKGTIPGEIRWVEKHELK